MAEESEDTQPDPEAVAAGGSGRSRAVLHRLGAVALGILLSLLILEVSFRVILYRHAQYIDRLREQSSREWGGDLTLFDIVKPGSLSRVYELYPNARGVFAGAPLSVNDAGFRDKPRSIAKPPGTFRICVVGDSIAFGWGVPAQQRFSDVLERFLNEESSTSGTLFECLNFGVPGYSTVMELAMLREQGYDYGADVLVLTLVSNDAELPNFVRVKPRVWSPTTSFIAEAIRDQLIGRIFGDTARAAAGGIAQTGGVGPASHISGFRPELVPPEYRFLMGWENMTSALCTMRSEAAQRAMAAVCMMHHPHMNSLLDLPTSTGLAHNSNARWFDEAVKCGFEKCDPLPAFLEYMRAHGLRERAIWVRDDDFHPNALAHALLARELFRTLLVKGLLPGAVAWSGATGRLEKRWGEIIERAARGE